jgi:hypothetical protein
LTAFLYRRSYKTRYTKPFLGYYTKCLHKYVRQGNGRGKAARTLVYRIMRLRKGENSDKDFERNFQEDYDCFSLLWRNRDSLIRSKMANESKQSSLFRCLRQTTMSVKLLEIDEFWGCRQQLRSGKVVAEVVARGTGFSIWCSF